MQFTLERDALLSALARLGSTASKRLTIPILTHIMVEAADNTVTLRATDLNIEATATCSAAVTKPGSACVPADKLSAIAKGASPGADIQFELGDKLVIKSGRSRFTVSTAPVEDFPVFKSFKIDAEFTLTPTEVSDLIGRVAFAMSKDMTKYMLTGMHMFCDGKVFGVVGADVPHLAFSSRTDTWNVFETLIPAPMVAEILRIAERDVTFKIGEKVSVASEGVVVTSTLMGVKYPPFRQLVPTSTPTIVSIEVAPLEAAIRRAQIAADDKDQTIRILIKDGGMQVGARNMMGDQATDEVQALHDGEPVAFSVNGSVFLAALTASRAEVVELAFQEDVKLPFLVRTPGDDFVNIVAPLRS